LVFCFLLLLGFLDRFEDFVGKALQLVAVPSLVLSLRVENANSIQETLVLIESHAVLAPIKAWPFHVGNRADMLPLLVIELLSLLSFQVTQLLVLLCLPHVEGRFLNQGILIADS
jgi:hypothetical protein